MARMAGSWYKAERTYIENYRAINYAGRKWDSWVIACTDALFIGPLKKTVTNPEASIELFPQGNHLAGTSPSEIDRTTNQKDGYNTDNAKEQESTEMSDS
ncbi:2167_t:CDS:2 [Acaulospora colombiana]|uniref:2167_t:CDS:1 n=1 Tax=Acaulospora colombiana TaxID=27376 RepID=A0ACA9LVN5_9GLOM|nr:2167_t:CDS:2 [Acaulospora colombiana]